MVPVIGAMRGLQMSRNVVTIITAIYASVLAMVSVMELQLVEEAGFSASAARTLLHREAMTRYNLMHIMQSDGGLNLLRGLWVSFRPVL